MKKIESELHRHYALLLGIQRPSMACDVKLEKVEIALQWVRGHQVPCPDCNQP